MTKLLFILSLFLFIGCTKSVEPYDSDKSYFKTHFYPAYHSNIQNKNDASHRKYPLIFLFGGSEGGMWFDSIDETKRLQSKGYHVVTVGYFDMEGLPKALNSINLNGFKKVLDEYKNYPSIKSDSMGVIGVSKGGELVLLLGSLYPEIHTVVAIVPSHVAFQSSNVTLYRNSSWVYNNLEVPFVAFPRLSIATIKGVLDGENYRAMHLEALKNKKAVEKARIKVENINGPLYLLSARHDQMWPSMEMSEEVVKRLKEKNFKHQFEHKVLDCDHYVLDQRGAWQGVLDFLDKVKR